MKKTATVALVAIAATAFIGCGKSTPKADLNNDVDSLSYAIGMEQSQGIKEYLSRMDIDTTYMDEFIKGLNAGVQAGDDKKKNAYNAGVAVGMQMAMMKKGINRQLFGSDSTESISMNNFVAGFAAGATGKNQKFTLQQAQMIEQAKAMAIQKKAAEKTYGAWKKQNQDFMAKIAKTAGVKALGKGVYYKVIKEGTGTVPSDTSSVTLQYEGKTVDGKVFDSSYKRNEPAKMKVNQVIPGFTEALTHMPAGSTWEIYIPDSAAYGERDMGQIKPFSTLIFKVELISVDK